MGAVPRRPTATVIPFCLSTGRAGYRNPDSYPCSARLDCAQEAPACPPSHPRPPNELRAPISLHRNTLVREPEVGPDERRSRKYSESHSSRHHSRDILSLTQPVDQPGAPATATPVFPRAFPRPCCVRLPKTTPRFGDSLGGLRGLGIESYSRLCPSPQRDTKQNQQKKTAAGTAQGNQR